MVAAKHNSAERFWKVFSSPFLARKRSNQIKEEALQYLGSCGLLDKSDDNVEALSFGQQKLIALGMVWMRSCHMVLLDEPFAGIDPIATENILARMREMKTRGCCLVLVEHNLPLVSRIADFVHALDQGQVIASGTAAEVLGSSRTKEAYGGI